MSWMVRPGRSALGVLAGFAVLAGTAVVTSAGPAAAAPRPGGPVVLLGTAGLRWDDVSDTTPALTAVLAQDAVAALSVRSVRTSTCPADGWLAVSAGRRAADAALPPGQACRDTSTSTGSAGGPGQVARWGVYREEAASGSFGADPGLLGSTLAAAGRSVAAVGPGAAIAVADRAGRVPRVWPGLPAGPDGTLDPGADALGLSQQVDAAVGSGADLVAVDLGAIRDVGAASGGSGPASRAEQVAGLDTRLGLILGRLPADATVILASLADDGTGPHLQVAAAYAPASAAGPALTAGYLRTASTRQDGLVQSTDLFATVLARLGAGVPATAAGSPLTRVAGGSVDSRLQRLTGLDQAATLLARLTVPLFASVIGVGLLLLTALGAAARAARLVPRARHRALTLLRLAAATLATFPAATFAAGLWPWWRGPAPGVQLTLAVLVAMAPLTLVVVAGPWRRHPLGPAGAAAGLTCLVLAADMVTGSHLSLIAPIGGQPLVGGRFYGMGNPAFALFGTAGLVLAAALATGVAALRDRPGAAGLAVAVTGLTVTVLDGAPGLGADVGGPPATVPAFGLLALSVAGIRLTWRRAALLGAATAVILGTLCIADWLRPPADRTHLGRFVQTLLDGGASEVITRKLTQNAGILTGSPLTLLIPPAAVITVLILARPGRFRITPLETAYRRLPVLRRTLAAIGVLLLIGFAMNDSGTSIPPVAMLLLLPALVAVTAHALDQDETQAREAAAAAAVRPVRRR